MRRRVNAIESRVAGAVWNGRSLAPGAIESLSTLSLEKKFYLAAAIGLAALLMLGGLASEVVKSFKRHSETADRSHAVLIQLTVLAAALGHTEHLRHDFLLSPTDAQKSAYFEANLHAARNVTALERLIQADSPLRAQVRFVSKLVEAQRASLLNPNEANLAGWPQAARPVWVSTMDNVQDLVAAMGRAAKLELEHFKAVEQARYWHIRNGAVAIGITACLLGALLLSIVHHDFARQRRAASTLAKNNDDLDLKVKEGTAELAAANDVLRRFSTQVEVAREAERLHIAREVHDALGSILTALKLELSGSVGDDRASWAEHARRRRASVELVDSALETVKHVVTELRPCVLDKFGLWEGLKWKAQQFEERMKILCHLSMAPGLPHPSNEVSIGIFRVVEEALTNVARHAEASRVDVVVNLHSGNLEVEISDNGRGITKERILSPDAFGLLSMRERARLRGGEFHITGNVGRGTTVRLRVPLERIHEPNQA